MARVHLSFNEKELKPYDRISLGVHEFMSQTIIEAAKTFLSAEMPSSQPTAVTAPAPAEP